MENNILINIGGKLVPLPKGTTENQRVEIQKLTEKCTLKELDDLILALNARRDYVLLLNFVYDNKVDQ